MGWLNWLEKRFGSCVIPNVTFWLVITQGFVYLADAGARGAGQAGLAERLVLVPALVLKGEVWRLITFPLVPPNLHPLVLLIYLAAFYYFGRAVEAAWGEFRYNAYLFFGFAFTAAAAFVAPTWPATGAQVKTSVFLAFATLYPDYVIRLYFIIPVRAKVLAALTWALFAYGFYVGNLSSRVILVAAVANYFLFFGRSAWRGVKDAKRRRDFRRRADTSAKPIQHECRVCGLTSGMAPKTAFRYCSQCAGQQCYCPDHLRDHEHVTEEQLAS